MKTIRRNAHRKIAAIALTIVKVKMYDQSTGEMVESTTEAALWNLKEYDFAKLYDHEDGKYTIHVHSNKFFYLYTQAFLTQEAAEKAERDAKYAAEREQWTAIAAPAAEKLNQVTVTRTRMAIGDQISQACTALGIKLGHGWNKGTATFLVNGRDYTAGELADLVLEGGFAANYGGNTVNVNWNCPLVPGRTQENRAGRALMITRELQARMGTATARELEEVAVSLLDMLHEWAIDDAPAPRVDFPSGAAEPGPEVTAVQCVRTGVVFERDGITWRNTSDDTTCNWYRLNETDPMSEGFQRYATKSVRRTMM